MLAELLPDRETARLLDSLEALGISSPELFVNRVRFAEDVRHCGRCQLARAWQMATLDSIRRKHREKKIYVVRNRNREIAGTSGLKSFTRELWQIL
jgi:anion-transporting  ArsA/GET3 family ATPase